MSLAQAAALPGRPSAVGPGWAMALVRAPSGARLEVHHRAGDDRWPALAAQYWDGRLEGLSRVASSRFAVVHRGRVPPDDQPCFFKRFLMRGWRDRVKRWVRASRARRALLHAEQVRALGFHTPHPLCLIEETLPGRVGGSALVTEAVEDAVSVREPILRSAPAGDLGSRRRFLDAFGRAVGAWHAAGLYHGDMSPRNILCRARGGQDEFVWLDHEGTRRLARLRMRLRVRNLVQVNKRLHPVSRTDRLRMARGYLEEARLPRAQARDLVRRVAAATARRVARPVSPRGAS